MGEGVAIAGVVAGESELFVGEGVTSTCWVSFGELSGVAVIVGRGVEVGFGVELMVVVGVGEEEGLDVGDVEGVGKGDALGEGETSGMPPPYILAADDRVIIVVLAGKAVLSIVVVKLE